MEGRRPTDGTSSGICLGGEMGLDRLDKLVRLLNQVTNRVRRKTGPGIIGHLSKVECSTQAPSHFRWKTPALHELLPKLRLYSFVRLRSNFVLHESSFSRVGHCIIRSRDCVV